MGAPILLSAFLTLLAVTGVHGVINLSPEGYFQRDGQLFFPVGVNYWPSSTGASLWSQTVNGTSLGTEIQHDLKVVKQSGFNTLRIFLVWGEFEQVKGVYNSSKLNDLTTILRWCEQEGLLVNLSVFVGWMSGHLYWPEWKDGNLYTNPEMIERSVAFATKISEVASPFRSNLIALEFGNEMDCCTDKATTSQIIAWTTKIYDALKSGCPDTLVIPGTDHHTIIGDNGWPLGGTLGNMTADLWDVHAYPVLFEPTKGDGLRDSLVQKVAPYYISFVRTFGPVMLQEWGTLITGGTEQQDEYLRAILPAVMKAGANGFLYWCMRDIVANHTIPYMTNGLETTLGLFPADSDEIKPGVKYYQEFAKALIANPVAPPRPKDPIGVYIPREYHFKDNPNNPGNHPENLSPLLTMTFHLLEELGHDIVLVRGDQSLPTTLKALIISSCYVTEVEVTALRQFVSNGGKLVWQGMDNNMWNNSDFTTLFGARASLFHDTPTPFDVAFGGDTWHFAGTYIGPGFPIIEVVHATTIAKSSAGNVVVLKNAVGSGLVMGVAHSVVTEPFTVQSYPSRRDHWQEWFRAILFELNISSTFRDSAQSDDQSIVYTPVRAKTTKRLSVEIASVAVYSGDAQPANLSIAALQKLHVYKERLLPGFTSIPAGTQAVVVPSQQTLSLPDIEVLAAFVKSGGCILWHGINTRQFSRLTFEMLGGAAADWRAPVPSTFSAFGESWTFTQFVRDVHTEFQASTSTFIAMDNKGIPSLFMNKYGQGTSVYATAAVELSLSSNSSRLSAWYRNELLLCQ